MLNFLVKTVYVCWTFLSYRGLVSLRIWVLDCRKDNFAADQHTEFDFDRKYKSAERCGPKIKLGQRWKHSSIGCNFYTGICYIDLLRQNTDDESKDPTSLRSHNKYLFLTFSRLTLVDLTVIVKLTGEVFSMTGWRRIWLYFIDKWKVSLLSHSNQLIIRFS